MKKHIITSLLLLVATLCASANDAMETIEMSELNTSENESPKYVSHIGTMWDLSIGKDWGFMRATVQQSVFTIDTELERTMSILSLDAPIIPTYLRVNALGFYLYYRMGQGNYRHLLRYHAGLSGSVPLRPLNITWATRYESTYVLGNDGPTNKFRARLRLVSKIPNSKIQPFIGSEFFLVLNNKNAGRGERIWYDIGVSYTIDKNNKIEFLVREEQMILTTPRQWNTNIGFAYKISL